MDKFEYGVVPVAIDRHVNIECLDVAGKNGWELVAVYEGHFYLKKLLCEAKPHIVVGVSKASL